jgi:flap endonuclease-1
LGFNLRPIAVREEIEPESLREKTLAVDGNNMLYQFLSLIRTPEGVSLKDSSGRTTSHLAGLLFRSTRLMFDYDIRLIFVFDGPPHPLKARVLADRRTTREKAKAEWGEALRRHDFQTAWSKAVVMSKLDEAMVDDAKRLLSCMGIPYVEAPGEGEAQAAFIASRGDAWAANSRDYDTLLFGAPRLVRYLTISGQEYLPSKGVSRPLKPELIELPRFLTHHGITREQFVDLAILVGTDFNEGIKGIGPKTALKLIRQYGRIEGLPQELKEKLQPDFDTLRSIFLRPNVRTDYSVDQGPVDEQAIFEFLCDERGFSRDRVSIAVDRMRSISKRRADVGLRRWMDK